VRVAGITTNFQQGAAQLTSRSTDMMINGDGFFTVAPAASSSTRGGSFNFDSLGQLVTADGGLVQGWAATNGVIDTNKPLTDLKLPIGTLMGAKATVNATLRATCVGPATATVLNRTIRFYDSAGNQRTLSLTFTCTAGHGPWGDRRSGHAGPAGDDFNGTVR